MKKRIIRLILICAMLFAGCAQTDAPEMAPAPETESTDESGYADENENNGVDSGSSDDVGSSDELSSIEDGNSGDDQSFAVDLVVHEDTDKRGNTIGNLINYGFSCPSDNGFVFYNAYMRSVGEYSRKDDFSEYVYPTFLIDMNIYDGYLYGISLLDGTNNTVLIRQNLKNKECDILKENVSDVSIVNDVLYYTDESGHLYGKPLDSDEETCIISDAAYQPCIYKDQIYYINQSDESKIYECDLSGANPRVLVDTRAKNLIVYKDYLYYSEGIARMGSIKRISIEGGTEEKLADAGVGCINIYEDKLYFVDARDLQFINYIDIADAELEVQRINFKDGLLGYYHDCEGDGQDSIEVTKYECMNFADGFMYLNAYFLVDGHEQLAVFCYDLDQYIIPALDCQPNERFDFDRYDINEFNWLLADNEKVYEKLTGKTVDINYTAEAAAEKEALEAKGEHYNIDKIEQSKPKVGSANIPNLDEASVQAAIYGLQSSYPEGMGWGMEKYAEFHGGLYCGGYACAAFAITVSDAIFGTLPARKIYDINAVRVGDVIGYVPDTGIGHSVVVLAVGEDSITVCEGNVNGQVHWGRTISKAELQASLGEIWTRYP